MVVLRLIFGVAMVAIGTVAVSGADPWEGWQWILSVLAAAAGIGGLAAALLSRRAPDPDRDPGPV